MPRADRLPSVGGTFEFWPRGETIGKLCSGVTFEMPQLKALEAKKVIERVIKPNRQTRSGGRIRYPCKARTALSRASSFFLPHSGHHPHRIPRPIARSGRRAHYRIRDASPQSRIRGCEKKAVPHETAFA